MIEITSLQNPRVKKVVSLYDRRDRDKTALFIIEGYREILRAHAFDQPIDELYFCPSLFLGSNENALIEALKKRGAALYSCDEKVFRKISYRDRPDGLLAIASKQQKTFNDIALSSPPFVVVAEAIEKPGNLGTILRSSDAAGVDGLIVADRCTDAHNPNVVRASVGTLFSVPIVEATTEETMKFLKSQSIQIVAATPDGNVDFTEANLTGPIAIVVGTEQLGLSSQWMDAADIQVKIPMHGAADSLNVAMATTLLLFEAVRQRKKHGTSL